MGLNQDRDSGPEQGVGLGNTPTTSVRGERAGILMPFGCRMGICHTCVVTRDSGRVRDLRNSTIRGGDHQKIQTCIAIVAGDCVLGV